MDNPINQDYIPPRDPSLGELPPVYPVDPSYTATQKPPKPPKLPKSSKKPIIITLLVVFLAAIAAGATYWYLTNYQSTPAPTETPVTQENQEPRPTSPLLTYVGNGSDDKRELMITDSNQKRITTLPQSEGKNNFTVLANNWDKILVEEYFFTYESPNDTAKNYFVIDKTGKSTKLPTSVATKLSEITINKPYFGRNNDLVYVDCDEDSCDLYSLDMETGETTSKYSVAYIPSGAAAEMSTLEILGVAWEGTAFTVIYKDGANKPGILTTIDLETKKLIKEERMEDNSLNTPDLSYDNSKLLYTALADNQTIMIMNTTTGKTEQVKPNIPAGPVYYWSFDNKTAAFVAETGSSEAVQGGVRVATINTADKTVKELINYGIKTANSITIGGWSSATLINLAHSQTAIPNDFSGVVPTIYSIDAVTGEITTNPLPLGYALVTPQSSGSINLSAGQ